MNQTILLSEMLSKLLSFNKVPNGRYQFCGIILFLSLVIVGITYVCQSRLSIYSSPGDAVNTAKLSKKIKDLWFIRRANKSLDDDMAEKDSIERREQVNKVCKNVNARNVLKDKKARHQKMNLYDHLVVNEKYKIIYCYIPKVACTNMKKIFVALSGKNSSIQKMTGVMVHRQENLLFINDRKFSEKQRTYMLENFYKFMIVRDPLERILSAYKSKWERKTMQLIELPWLLAIGEQIIRKYRYNKTKKDVRTDIVAFSEYIHHIIDTPSHELNEHWMPYNDLCRPCDVQYDFIGSIETLIRDVAHVMRHIKANETKYFIAVTPKDALTRTKKSTASFYKDLPQEHFKRLVKMFQLDHELFGYSLPEFRKLDERYTAGEFEKSHS